MIKEINGVNYTIDEKLDNFTIKSKPSSNVAFYGVNHDAADIQLFVQFKNGSCYIYSGLTDQTLADLNECESIGSFISRNIVGKFPNIKCEEALVKLAPLYSKEDYQNHNNEIDLINASMKSSGRSIFDDVDDPTF